MWFYEISVIVFGVFIIVLIVSVELLLLVVGVDKLYYGLCIDFNWEMVG